MVLLVMKMKVVVVGGSIAGLACANALIRAGCEVIVVEKARSITSAGAGLGLDPVACRVLDQWGLHPQLIQTTLPLTIDENRATDKKRNWSGILARDENLNFRAAHWSDLHRILYEKLPPNTVRWGHEFVSFHEEMKDMLGIKVAVKVVQSDEVIGIDGDLLVAADGSMSLIRRHFLPHENRRYLGYCAWRGVYDYSDDSLPEMIASIWKVYPDLGNCLYFDLAKGTHCVLYELHGKRLNWLWYVNQPEPHVKEDSSMTEDDSSKGSSLTVKVDETAIARMHEEADETWLPELSALMKATPKPFVNVLYDREPLKRLVWDRVVLVGEAAHPTSPHGLRSTNMSILDASVLGHSIAKWGFRNIAAALEEYQSTRLPVISEQVLYSRHLGLLKQGLLFDPSRLFPWLEADSGLRDQLLQRNMPFLKFSGLNEDKFISN